MCCTAYLLCRSCALLTRDCTAYRVGRRLRLQYGGVSITIRGVRSYGHWAVAPTTSAELQSALSLVLRIARTNQLN